MTLLLFRCCGFAELVFVAELEYEETVVINLFLLLLLVFSKLLVNFDANEEMTEVEADELDETTVDTEFIVDDGTVVMTSTVGAFLIEFFNACMELL